LPHKLAVVAALLASTIVTAHAGGPPSGLVEKFLAAEANTLTSYRAIRRMTASTRGGRMQATMEVLTTLDQVAGFRYEIQSEDGSALIRRKVLVAALEAEQQAYRTNESGAARLTQQNYEFVGVSVASENLYKIDVRARRKNQMLIDGAVFVEGDSADLVRMEGELSKRPSFWTRRVRIIREYGRVEGVHVPLAMDSTADILVVGASTFSMTYRYLEVNGRPVTEKTGAHIRPPQIRGEAAGRQAGGSP
jgi:hypothetical protein